MPCEGCHNKNLATTIAGGLKAQTQPERVTIERLFDTAADLFWDKGYAATTTRAIAAALNIQQASLYYHIASKEDLLHKLCVSSLREFLERIPAAVSEVSDPVERIRALIRAHVATLLRRQKHNAAMLTELRALSGPYRAEVVDLRRQYRNFVRAILEDAQRAGRLRGDISAQYLCLALLNMLNWSALWFRREQALSADELAEIFIEIYLHGAALRGPRHELAPLDFNHQSKGGRARKTARAGDNSTTKRLLSAAAELFSRKGYAATSTREVAALLGIQKASLYYHIESKEDLLYLISKSSLEGIRSDIEAAVGELQDPLDRTRALICTHMESMLRDAEEHGTTLAEMRSLSRERRADVKALRHAYEDLVRSVLRDAQRAGVLREDIDAKYLCLALLGLMNRTLVWYRRRKASSPAQLGQLMAVVFLTGAAA